MRSIADRARRLTAPLAVATVALIACASDDTPAADEPANNGALSVFGLDDIPPDQRHAFEDGTVSVAEYHAAFNEFERCANVDGRKVVDVATDPITGLITYGVIGELSSYESNGTLLDDCYQQYFVWIEAEWQTTDPAFLAHQREQQLDRFRTDFQLCLENDGIEIPDDLEPGTQTFGELITHALDLVNRGDCVLPP